MAAVLNDAELRSAFAGLESFAAIARRAGVSREYIRQIYNRRFADQFPNRLNAVRVKVASGKISELLNSYAERRTEAAMLAANAAINAGCGVEPIVRIRRRGRMSIASNFVLINGSRCNCQQSRILVYPGLRAGLVNKYYRFTISRRPVADFHVFIAGKNTFILPADLLHSHYPSGFIYIPPEQPSRSRSKIDWWQYKDGWWQLRRLKGRGLQLLGTETQAGEPDCT